MSVRRERHGRPTTLIQRRQASQRRGRYELPLAFNEAANVGVFPTPGQSGTRMTLSVATTNEATLPLANAQIYPFPRTARRRAATCWPAWRARLEPSRLKRPAGRQDEGADPAYLQCGTLCLADASRMRQKVIWSRCAGGTQKSSLDRERRYSWTSELALDVRCALSNLSQFLLSYPGRGPLPRQDEAFRERYLLLRPVISSTS
ncbi:hypothetical protein FKP32DRAFT_1214947 [Trametes sanguinea]|nr:hypothetical protein FKP32DRAFT_1214947 [Trametes sanguinea]